MSKYIVSIGRNKEECTELINNGDIEITKSEIIIDFLIEEDRFKKTINIDEIKKRQIKFNYAVNDTTQLIKIEYNLENYYLKFDDNSKGAYQSFCQDLENINKVNGVLYYESGNIRMSGDFILDEESTRYSANGDAIVYYDDINDSIMYKGEIENENYDGSGIFYNKSGNISLKINNIDQNMPIGKGFLIINDFSGKKYYEKEINFDEMDDINLMNIDLDDFVKHNRKGGIFKDLLYYSDFNEKYELDKKVDVQYKEIITLTTKEQNEKIYKKQLEMDIKMDELIGKINFIFDKVNEKKKSGFLW